MRPGAAIPAAQALTMLLPFAMLAVSAVYVIAGVISRRVQLRKPTGLLFVLVGSDWLPGGAVGMIRR